MMKRTAWLAVFLAFWITPALAENFSVVLLPQETVVTPVENVYQLEEEGTYVLSGSTTACRVQVMANATLLLDGAEMDLSAGEIGLSPIRIQSGAKGTLIVAKGSQNVLKASSGAAAVQTIGSVVIRCESGAHDCTPACGSLQAYGGAVCESLNAGAGIGGAQRKTNGAVTIEGGRISAYGGSESEGTGGGAAGIGGGGGRTLTSVDGELITLPSSTADGTSITITGGIIHAQGGTGAAGIGGGDWGGKGVNIQISGGDVTARGGAGAAGIGGGFMGSADNIRISGGCVNAFGGEEASAIGGGIGENGTNLVISGGWVRAAVEAQYSYPWYTDAEEGASPVNDAIGSGSESVGSSVKIAPPLGKRLAVYAGPNAGELAGVAGSPFALQTDLALLLDDAGFVEICPSAPQAGEMDDSRVLKLPGGLKEIRSTAFAGTEFTYVICPDQLETIGADAFKGCVNLSGIEIPASVTSISATAFSGVPSDVLIVAPEGSAAQKFAKQNGYATAVP